MSVVISTPEQINRSPINNSKAKMLYSFGKSQRFRTNKENQCDQFYEVSSHSHNKRTTSLGYGTKYDFTKDLPKTPSPGSYEANTLFQQSKKHNKGFGFGSGRGEMKATGLIKKNQNPGPGAYQIPSSKATRYSSIKGKGKIDNREQIYVPGPGAYQSSVSLNKSGLTFLSMFKNRNACKFGKQQKLIYENLKVPGPGTYDSSKTEFSSQGKYCLSRLQSAKTSKFGKSLRDAYKNRCQTPGPGSYRMPSEFGYYANKKFVLEARNSAHQ